MISVEDRRKQLLSRLAELDSRLHQIESDLDAPHSKDWDEAAVETEGDEVLEGLGHQGEEFRRKVLDLVAAGRPIAQIAADLGISD